MTENDSHAPAARLAPPRRGDAVIAALVAMVVLAGAAAQTTTGFGFALLAAPVLSLAYGPHQAVGTVTVLGLAVNVLTLHAAARPLVREAGGLLLWALPGLVLGSVALAALPVAPLDALIAAAVLAAVAAQVRGGAALPASRRGAWRGAAGLAAGALTTSTGLNGPPLVLYLRARAPDADRRRATLAALFLVLGLLALAVLVARGLLDVPGALPLLVAAAVLGQLLGRRAFVALHPRAVEALTVALLVLSAAAALVAAARQLLPAG